MEEIKGLYKKNGICYDSGKEITREEYDRRIAVADELYGEIEAAKEDLEEIKQAGAALDRVLYAMHVDQANGIKWKDGCCEKLATAYGEVRKAKWELEKIIENMEKKEE